MAAFSIRGLDDDVRDRLRVRAANHGRSMEAEIRKILSDAVNNSPESGGLGNAILHEFGNLGGVDLDTPQRTELPRHAKVDR